MKLINCSTPKFPNTFAMVDDEDYENIEFGGKWTAASACNTIYAERGGTRMHRVLMNPPKDMHVDHIDGNGLNNQRSNLRICTPAQNNANKPKRRDGRSSIYMGVTFDKANQKFRATIQKGGKILRLGRFALEKDAAIAYNIKAKELQGEFARLNQIVVEESLSEYDKALRDLEKYLPDGFVAQDESGWIYFHSAKPYRDATGHEGFWASESDIQFTINEGFRIPKCEEWPTSCREIRAGRVVPQGEGGRNG